MTTDTKLLQEKLVRKYLGKSGIHSLSIDEPAGAVKIYYERSGGKQGKALANLKKDAEPLAVEAIESPKAALL